MPERFHAVVPMTERREKAEKFTFVTTKRGKRLMKIIGECQEAGGTVSARTWHKEDQSEWMEAECVWPAKDTAL
jgi:hypothetical protein